MTRRLLFAGLFTALLLTTACASEAPGTEASTDSGAAPSVAADSLTGMWKGDWGPSATHRNDVMLDLKWEGANLIGIVNPGPNAAPLTKGSYVADTGAVMLETDVKGRGGETVHYTIEGKIEGNTMTGSWNHGDQKGDFKIAKQ